MTRRAFYSFHYKLDNWRVSQVRNIGSVESNKPASDNDWETVTKGGDDKIQKWIDGQLKGRGCTVVLIGENTAGRKWINYEIKKSWDDRKGLLGIHIHNLKNVSGKQSTKGVNPFSTFTACDGNKKLTSVVKCYDPPYTTSTFVYEHIAENIEDWIEAAIEARDEFKC